MTFILCLQPMDFLRDLVVFPICSAQVFPGIYRDDCLFDVFVEPIHIDICE